VGVARQGRTADAFLFTRLGRSRDARRGNTVNAHRRRGSNWLLTGGSAACIMVAAQTGCMPDFDAITSKWQAESGAGGKGNHGGSPSGGRAPQAGTANGGASNAGKASGGRASGGKPNGGRPSAGGTGGTSVGNSGPGGEAGTDNGGNGGATEGGATGVGGTSSGTAGSGGTSPNGGEAGAPCDPGFKTCPFFEDCSTQLSEGNAVSQTFANCGECGVTCSVTHATSAACTAGHCEPACATNFADCNASSANDGCEADLTSVTTCGSCGHACSTQGAAARACTGGLCAPTCGGGYLDCAADDGTQPDDGCDTFADSLATCGVTCSSAGVACGPTEVCNAGLCGSASGLVALSVPFASSGQTQRFADVFQAGPDLTGATVTVRMYAPGATNGTLSTYLVDLNASPTFSVPVFTEFATLSAGWTDIVVPVPPAGGTFDTTHVHQVTFDFASTGTPAINPTVIYIDRVWSSDLTIQDGFDSGFGSMIPSSLQKIDGSTLGWVSATP
jgi:hypothetical protein